MDGAAATMTVVRPRLPFGVAQLNGDGVVRGFAEKPRSEHVDQRRLLLLRAARSSTCSTPDSVLEREPLERLAAAGQLRAYRHDGLLGLHGHLQGRGRAQRPVGRRRAPRGSDGVDTWAETRNGPAQSVLVTGAHGLLGAWLTAALLDARRPRRGRSAATTPAARRWRCSDCVERRRHRSRRRLRGRAGRARARRVRGRQRLPPRRPDARGHRQPLAAVDVRDQRPRHLDAAGGVPRARRRAASSWPPRTRPTAARPSCPTARRQPLPPTFPYDVSKAAADLIARSYWHTFGLPVAVTRFANLYGGGDINRRRLVPEAVGAALAGRAPVIRSDGSPERDFLYVEDAVAAYLAIWRAAAGRPGRRRGVQRRRWATAPGRRRGRPHLPSGRRGGGRRPTDPRSDEIRGAGAAR